MDNHVWERRINNDESKMIHQPQRVADVHLSSRRIRYALRRGRREAVFLYAAMRWSQLALSEQIDCAGVCQLLEKHRTSVGTRAELLGRY